MEERSEYPIHGIINRALLISRGADEPELTLRASAFTELPFNPAYLNDHHLKDG